MAPRQLHEFADACRQIVSRTGQLLAHRQEPQHVGAPWLTDKDLSLLRELAAGASAALQNVQALSDQSMAQQQLAASERRFRSLVERSWDAISLVNPDGAVRYSTPAFHRILGYAPGEFGSDRRVFDMIHPQDVSRVSELFFELLIEPQGSRRAQFRFLHRDGSWRWIDAWATNLLQDEAVQAVVVNYRDITPWKAVESDRQRLVEQAQAERDRAEAANRAKDQFLAVLSHELRTPLTPVLAVVTDLEARGAVPEPIRSDIDLIRRNVEMEARLIDDLLDLTRISRGKLPLRLETVDAHELLRHAYQTCCTQDVSEKQLDVTLALDAPRHHVRGDAARLQQVFWNLIGNAVKFTPTGASIRIASSGDDRTLRIEIADTGIGIHPELLPRIFNAFEQGERTVTRRFGGLGLGLTISKQIIELHGGTIRVFSDGPNRGARFAIELALVQAPAQAPPAPRPAEAAPVAGRRILLVEDDPDTARVMARLLRFRGFEVTTAGDVAAALDAAARQTFDLVVSDLGLPDRSGLEIPAELRKSRPLPAIALSGFGMDEDLQKSAEAGFAEHLVKPIDFQVLVNAIERLLQR